MTFYLRLSYQRDRTVVARHIFAVAYWNELCAKTGHLSIEHESLTT